jgi:hypothetical protein
MYADIEAGWHPWITPPGAVVPILSVPARCTQPGLPYIVQMNARLLIADVHN